MTTLLDPPATTDLDLSLAPVRAGAAGVGPAFVDLLRHRHDALCWWDHRTARWTCDGAGGPAA